MAIMAVCIIALVGFSNVNRQATIEGRADVYLLDTELILLRPSVLRLVPNDNRPGGRTSWLYGAALGFARLPEMLTGFCARVHVFVSRYSRCSTKRRGSSGLATTPANNGTAQMVISPSPTRLRPAHASPANSATLVCNKRTSLLYSACWSTLSSCSMVSRMEEAGVRQV